MSAIRKIRQTPLTAALGYGAAGYAVLPLRPGSKVPLLPEWQRLASTDAQFIHRHWRQHPKAGIGIHCGKSGLVVIDVDKRNGGLETFARLEARNGPAWAEGCAIARTGGGGWHYVFAAPTGVRLPAKLGPGVDLLHGDHYFAAEPTVHPVTGEAYRWERGCDLVNMSEVSVLPEAWCTPLDSPTTTTTVDPLDALATITPRPLEDTPEDRERVRSAAAALSADCDYHEWMRRVFAILSTGLPYAAEVAREWSLTAPDRFDDRAFDTLVDSYKEERRHGGDLIGPGTLFHLAKQAGWKDPAAKQKTSEPKTFRVIPAHEFVNTGPVEWLVRGLVQRDGLGVIFGESGAGKSFVVLDLSGAIARGVDWRGLPVMQGPVVYIAAEGASGFRKRMQALAQHTGVPLEGVQVGVIADAPNFLTAGDDEAIAAAVKEAGGAVLIVVDTLASVTPGGNENAGEDMGEVIARCKYLQQETGAFVLLVHHSGKDASKGARGWSGLRAAVDVEIEVTRNGDERVARVSKQKDGEDGTAFPFRLKVIEIGTDEDGEPVTSCVIEHVDELPAGAQREPGGTVQKIVYQAVKTFGPCSVDEVLKQAVNRMVHDPEKKDKRREHARRALEGLIAAKFLNRDYSGAVGLYGSVSTVWDVDPDTGECLSEGGL